eukprot:5209173-Amphidinium_carterae.1
MLRLMHEHAAPMGRPSAQFKYTLRTWLVLVSPEMLRPMLCTCWLSYRGARTVKTLYRFCCLHRRICTFAPPFETKRTPQGKQHVRIA